MAALEESDDGVETVLKSIIDLGREMKMRVTVEGVETEGVGTGGLDGALSYFAAYDYVSFFLLFLSLLGAFGIVGKGRGGFGLMLMEIGVCKQSG